MALFRSRLLAAGLILPFSVNITSAEQKINPQVRRIVAEVSESRMRATLEKLVSFGTRNTMSDTHGSDRGIGAARQWIFNELQSYSPRLQVRFDKAHFREVDVNSIVAVLPGNAMADVQVVISAHYDSASKDGPDAPAPGANDDGSGTAAVMELARVLGRYKFDKTLVFMAFAGEEQGLIGSRQLAEKAKAESQQIEAVLYNDIIGNALFENDPISAVNVYVGNIPESPSQRLGRFTHEIGELYVPEMKVNLVLMQDRLGRSGDHSSFQERGFAAVRFTTPWEILADQHNERDTLENMSVRYAARVAKVNTAVAATLAMAPNAPITRSASALGNNVTLRWSPAGADSTITRYAIVLRPPGSSFWQQEIYVGKVTQYTLKDASLNGFRFGVKAIGSDGSESLVSSFEFLK